MSRTAHGRIVLTPQQIRRLTEAWDKAENREKLAQRFGISKETARREVAKVQKEK
jgi:DeoR/GlpR family transcriptional regulator of sugar metabolism